MGIRAAVLSANAPLTCARGAPSVSGVGTLGWSAPAGQAADIYWGVFMSHVLRRNGALIAIIGVAVGLVTASPAHAVSSVSCGSVIVVDTVLTEDLVCDGSSDGLEVGADGVTLDLGGHTITGPGAYLTPYSGIRVTGRTGVTIVRGSITGWQSAVTFNEASHGTVNKLSATGNDRGLTLAGGADHVVSQSTFSNNGRDGISLGLSARNTITQNVVDGNTWGITVATYSSGNTISRNTVTNSRSNGIAVFGGSVSTVISQNTVTGSWADGITTSADTSESTLSQNKSLMNGGDGFDVARALLVKNTATGNGGHGIVAVDSTDGGGNKAGANLTTPDCVGIACSAV